MILSLKPFQFLSGRIRIPPSKSYSIRAFIIAACGGKSRIIDPSCCDDALVAREVAQALGAEVRPLKGNVWQVRASERKIRLREINVGESGTVLRLLLPLLAGQERDFVVVGRKTLIGRPNAHLLKTLRTMGADIRGQGKKESIPIFIRGKRIHGGTIEIEATMSSQFISALLIACPLLNEDTKLVIKGKKLVSQAYVDMTLEVLKKAGITIHRRNRRLFHIPGEQRYEGLGDFVVPADYGLAAFFLAAAALIPSEMILEGSLSDPLIQADGEIFSFLSRMGVRFERRSSAIHIHGPFELKGGEFCLRDCPDLVPIMSILALFAKGKTRLYDIQHVRAKESDRISDLGRELLKTGAKIEGGPNDLIIIPQRIYQTNRLLQSHHDHRLAMAFAVLGLKIGARVADIECSRKSYPDFVRDLSILGAKVS